MVCGHWQLCPLFFSTRESEALAAASWEWTYFSSSADISSHLLFLRKSSQENSRQRYFYERRARRILPALILVLICSGVFSWFWLLPGDLNLFSQSTIAVLIVFATEQTRSENYSGAKPLVGIGLISYSLFLCTFHSLNLLARPVRDTKVFVALASSRRA